MEDRIYNTYYQEVGVESVLSVEEEQTLFLAHCYCGACATKFQLGKHEIACRVCGAKRNMAARDKIVRANLRFVVKQAHSFAGSNHEDFLKMISSGNLGLLRAVDRFDPDRGLRFLTYAGHWVHKEMREDKDQDRTVHVPLHRLKEMRSKRREGKESADPAMVCTLKEGMDPTDDPTDQFMNMFSAEKWRDVIHTSTLRLREKFLLFYYYDLCNEDRRLDTSPTLREVANILGVTPERIRQIKESVFTRITAKLPIEMDARANP